MALINYTVVKFLTYSDISFIDIKTYLTNHTNPHTQLSTLLKYFLIHLKYSKFNFELSFSTRL